jgi:hypothetical protein
LSPNPYFRETRAVSQDLIVLPLYYVVDNVCPRLTYLIATLRPGTSDRILIEIKVPENYTVLSSMDRRGFGANGSYILPLQGLVSDYIYDGVVIASKNKYGVESLGGVFVVAPLGKAIGSDIINALICAKEYMSEVFGPSNRSPVVLVLVPPSEHPLVLTGTGYSLGGVVYIKPDNDRSAAVHIVSHEAIHSWIGKGQLRGDPSLTEGAAELLSLLALRQCNATLYKLSLSHEEAAKTLNPYYVWLKLHASMRAASLLACNKDIYTEALKLLYDEEAKDASILDLLERMRGLADEMNCTKALEKEMGRILLYSDKYSLSSLIGQAQTKHIVTLGRQGESTTTTTVRTTTSVSYEEKSLARTSRAKNVKEQKHSCTSLLNNSYASIGIRQEYKDSGKRATSVDWGIVLGVTVVVALVLFYYKYTNNRK